MDLLLDSDSGTQHCHENEQAERIQDGRQGLYNRCDLHEDSVPQPLDNEELHHNEQRDAKESQQERTGRVSTGCESLIANVIHEIGINEAVHLVSG